MDEDYGRVVLICGRFEVLCTNLVLLLRSDGDVHFFGGRSITVKLLDEQDVCFFLLGTKARSRFKFYTS